LSLVIRGGKSLTGSRPLDPGLPTPGSLPTLAVVTGRRHLLAAALSFITSLTWAGALTVAPQPWTALAAGVIAVGILVAAAVAVTLVVVQSSQVGYRLSWGLLVVEALIAGLQPINALWWAGVLLIAATGASLTEPTLGGWIRQQPPPTPVPAPSLALCLLLLASGPVTALASPSVELPWLPPLTFGAWLVLVWYVRRWPGRELAPRLATPLLGVGGLLLPGPARLVWIGVMLTATVLAWTVGSRLAVRPIVERGHPVPIPPELAPADVLHSAGIDDKGRKRAQT
jgi:hypothetical protein